MLTVEQAFDAVMARVAPLPPRRVALLETLGSILAEPISADLDLPPFDKSLLDGYAVRSSECQGDGPFRLLVGEEIVAGTTPSRPLNPGEAASIMTGAPLPLGADAVVMHEKTTREGRHVVVSGPIRKDEGRLVRGREMRTGEVVVEAGTRLNPAHLGVLASVGRSEVLVQDRPRVAILPTGDELVPIRRFPGPGQIRETNSTVLAALVRSLGFVADPRPAVADDLASLVAAVRQALSESDLLIVCGGVSAGDRDFVPEALSAVDVERVFHKVSLKPGKPLFFGMSAGQDRKPVFGLPGNPVSGLVGFLLFVGPALWALHAQGKRRWPRKKVRLASRFSHRADRPSYHPSRAVAPGSEVYEALPTSGSADLCSVSRADGFLCFPSGTSVFEAGEELDFLPITI